MNTKNDKVTKKKTKGRPPQTKTAVLMAWIAANDVDVSSIKNPVRVAKVLQLLWDKRDARLLQFPAKIVDHGDQVVLNKQNCEFPRDADLATSALKLGLIVLRIYARPMYPDDAPLTLTDFPDALARECISQNYAVGSDAATFATQGRPELAVAVVRQRFIRMDCPNFSETCPILGLSSTAVYDAIKTEVALGIARVVKSPTAKEEDLRYHLTAINPNFPVVALPETCRSTLDNVIENGIRTKGWEHQEWWDPIIRLRLHLSAQALINILPRVYYAVTTTVGYQRITEKIVLNVVELAARSGDPQMVYIVTRGASPIDALRMAMGLCDPESYIDAAVVGPCDIEGHADDK